MKASGFLIILFILLFAAQFTIFGRKADQALNAAQQALVEQGPREAYALFKPAFGYSNVKTLGRANRARTKFLEACVKEAVLPIQRGKLDFPGAVRVEATLETLGAVKADWQIDVAERQTEILRNLSNQLSILSEGSDLAAWDHTIRTLERARDSGWGSDAFRPQLDTMIGDFKRVDRRGIGLREAKLRAADHLAKGVEALGLRAGKAPEDGLFAPLPDKPAQQALINADSLFANGLSICQGFARAFGEGSMPPELHALHSKLLHNLCAMRTQHILTDGGRMVEEPSDYLVHLYVRPGTTDIPSGSEMYGAFLGTVQQQITELNRDVNALGPRLGGSSAAVRAAAARTQNIYDAAMRRGGDAGFKYSQLKSEALNSPEARAAMETIDASANPCVFIQ